MSENNPPEGNGNRLADAYHRMLERLKLAVDRWEHGADTTLHRTLDEVQEKATELDELTREEAEKVGEYLKRDLQDAAVYLNDSGKEMRDWLRFDMQLVEDRLLDAFSSVADKTRLELLELQQRADAGGEWHSGEVCGIGTLECKSCGEQLHFHAPGHIPPCPKCHGTTFRRISHSDE